MDDDRKILGSATDSEDFTSDSGAMPDDSIDTGEDFVLEMRERMPFEPDLVRAGAVTEDEDPYAGLLELAEEDSDYGSEDEEENKDEREGLLLSKLSHIEKENADRIIGSIKNMRITAWSLDDLRHADVPVSHSFELTEDTPISHAARRLPPRHNAVVREEIDNMHKAGIISPSAAAWSFPVVIATKKDGKLRFCVDYRALNRVMKADNWPLPKMEEMFDDLEGSKALITLDLFTGH